MQEYKTDKFRVYPINYFRAESYGSARKLFFIFLSIFIVSVALSFYNLVFLFVGLIVFFLIIPTLVALVYFYKLLTIDAQRNLSEKSLTIKKGREIMVVYENENIKDCIIEWKSIYSVLKRHKHIEIRSIDKKLLLLVPEHILDANEIFHEFYKNMSWEERKE